MEHTGLYEIVQRPTRGLNNLDRVYISRGGYDHVKVTTPTIKTDHKAIIAYNGVTKTALNKTRRTVHYRVKKPAQVGRYREKLSQEDLIPAPSENVQVSFDLFYNRLVSLISE